MGDVMAKLTAAQMTGELPMDYPAEPPRRLTRKERRLLSRILAELREETLLSCYLRAPAEAVMVARIEEKIRVKRRRRG